MELVPRQRPAQQAWHWWRVAFALLAQWSSLLGFVIPALCLWASLAIAAGVDQRAPTTPAELWRCFYAALPRALNASLSTIAVFSAFVVVSFVFNGFQFPDNEVANEMAARAAAEDATKGPLTLWLQPAYGGLVSAGFANLLVFAGFAVPLYVVLGVSPLFAWALGIEGLELNWRPVALSTCTLMVFLSLAQAYLPLLIVVGYPFVSALLYVAMRDVFLGTPDNTLQESFVAARLAHA